jgi:carboxyl-terminal processing protease
MRTIAVVPIRDQTIAGRDLFGGVTGERQTGGGEMKKRHHQGISHLGFLVLGLIVGAILGCQILGAFTPSDKIPAEAARNFGLMGEAWNTIQGVYVDRQAVKPQLLTYGAISGMVDSLGDSGHSRFLSAEMMKQERNFSKGLLEGIGAEVQTKNNQLVIVASMDGTPAQRAGLKPGDIILKVNGKEVSGLPLEQAVGQIIGPPGTSVNLTILNPGTGRTINLTLVRARIKLRNVKWQRLPGTTVAHVRIASFSKGVSNDLRQGLMAIHKEKLSGLILDLRNNPGGLFDEAVGTASQFLGSGKVVLEKKGKGEVRPVPVRPGGLAMAIPMVLLINGGTASAPEIVAGALQDAYRATLVGEKTFGTGTVLKPFILSDGSALLLAIEEWLTPAGHVIWHKGISPDVFVPLPPEVSPVFPEAEKGMTTTELRESKGEQLLSALDLLTHPLASRTIKYRSNPMVPGWPRVEGKSVIPRYPNSPDRKDGAQDAANKNPISTRNKKEAPTRPSFCSKERPLSC